MAQHNKSFCADFIKKRLLSYIREDNAAYLINRLKLELFLHDFGACFYKTRCPSHVNPDGMGLAQHCSGSLLGLLAGRVLSRMTGKED